MELDELRGKYREQLLISEEINSTIYIIFRSAKSLIITIIIQAVYGKDALFSPLMNSITHQMSEFLFHDHPL